MVNKMNPNLEVGMRQLRTPTRSNTDNLYHDIETEMPPSHDTPPTAGKIAIKGFSLSSKVNAKSSPAPPSNLGKRSRTHFGHDSDSEDERHPSGGKYEAVTGFGAQGAELGENEPKRRGGELVIKRIANRDWRGEARRRQNAGRDLLPKEERARRDAQEGGKGRVEGVDVVNGDESAIQWGLSVRKRALAAGEEGDGETSAPVQNQDSTAGTQEGDAGTAALPRTADEEALASLLGADTQSKGPDLVIASVAPLSELDAYKAAVLAAPDVSTLEDYERIPVEEFGAAMLRGMGWKGEKVAKPKDIKRRQNLLGLGAKELDGAEELGAWVQKSDVKRLKPGGKGGGSHGERRAKPGDYKRERERERDRREERGGWEL
ncbi:hypothetical protein QTJ16_000827 [Diplocarpon rosae]|uniref:Pre-mRNA-splicing factor n=1 Tax=Diplocarpon rosae TaxID=946125 RepID=A0AAD9T725_9HELO|nr:hypothetical protein QTJ16_000827 [Diplocarpon rosae]